MSDTPRTDEELGDGSDLSSISDAVDWACQLERELTAANKRIAALEAAMIRERGQLERRILELESRSAALDSTANEKIAALEAAGEVETQTGSSRARGREAMSDTPPDPHVCENCGGVLTHVFKIERDLAVANQRIAALEAELASRDQQAVTLANQAGVLAAQEKQSRARIAALEAELAKDICEATPCLKIGEIQLEKIIQAR